MIKICKFSSSTTNDWVQVCGDTQENLKDYKFYDSANNLLSENISCVLNPNGSYYFTASNRLNNDGDYIVMKDGNGNVVDCISYGGSTCPSDDVHVSINTSECAVDDNNSWTSTSDCTYSNNSECLAYTPTPTMTTAPTNTPTITLTPTPTSIPTNTSNPARINIYTIPSSANTATNFYINVIAENLKKNTDYYLKAYGGINDDVYSVEVYNNGVYYNGGNGNWSDMPKFTSDINGIINPNLTLRIKSDKSSGDYKVTAKIREINTTNDINSGQYSIKIYASTPTPAISLTPTSNKTPMPTMYMSPTVVNNIENFTSNNTSEQVLGESVEVKDIQIASPTKKPLMKADIVSLFPIILIVFGCVMLIAPIIWSKIKNREK